MKNRMNRLLCCVLFATFVLANRAGFADTPIPGPDDPAVCVFKNAAGVPVATTTEAGFLIVLGEMNDGLASITLDPAKKYYSVKNDNDAVVFALELETGHAYSTGAVEDYDAIPAEIQTLATFGPAGPAIGPDGTVYTPGLLPWHPGFSHMPPLQVPNWDEIIGRVLGKPNFTYEDLPVDGTGTMVPEPIAQGRIFYLTESVTCQQWRLRFMPSYLATVSEIDDENPVPADQEEREKRIKWQTAENYGVKFGMEFHDGSSSFWPVYAIADTAIPSNNGDWYWNTTEKDRLFKRNPLYLDDETGTEKPYKIDEFVHSDILKAPVGGWVPLLDHPALYNLSVLQADSNNHMFKVSDVPPFYFPDDEESVDGSTVDSIATPWSQLFLYDMNFTHPDTIPRNANDPSVPIGCDLTPLNTPGFCYMKLTVHDPANPSNMYSWDYIDTPYFATLWDGKLYPWGIEIPGTEVYADASDVFLKATVYWYVPTDNPQPPPVDYEPKAWENYSDEFIEPKLAMVVTDDGISVSNNIDSFAYITSSPTMPGLRAKMVSSDASVLPAPVWLDYEGWDISITYDKPERTDTDSYSSENFVSPSVEWDIISDMNNEFRGGKATVTCDLYSGEQYEHKFQIRGLNPDDADAQQYIFDNDDIHWYADAITRHECKQYPYYYNQFNEVAGTLGPNYLTEVEKCPNRHADGGGTYGWGLMQLTHVGDEIADPSKQWFDAEDLWNWKNHVDTGVEHLQVKREQSSFHNYPNHSTQGLPPFVYINGYYFTYDSSYLCGYGNYEWEFSELNSRSYHDLDAIKRNNGGLAFSYDPQGDIWTESASNSNETDYTWKIMSEFVGGE